MTFKKGIKISCPNCGGHTRVVGKYGECDYCGSLLINPITQATQLPRAESMARFQATETVQEIENILRKAGHPMCVSDICQRMSEPISAQKCAVYLRKLVDCGKAERIAERGKVYYLEIGA